MTRPARDPLRPARLVAFAVCATVIALAAHVAAGGNPPGVLGTLLAAAVPAVAGWASSRRPRRLLGILPVLAATQLLQHEVLGVTATTPAGSMTMPGGARPGGMSPAHHGGPLWMLGAHAAAVVVTAALLARGECLLEALARRLRALPRLLPGRPCLPWDLRTPTAATVTSGPVRPGAGLLAAMPVVRRGPPCRAC